MERPKNNIETQENNYDWKNMSFEETEKALGGLAGDIWRENRDTTEKELAEKIQEHYLEGHTVDVTLNSDSSKRAFQGAGQCHYGGNEEEFLGDVIQFSF